MVRRSFIPYLVLALAALVVSFINIVLGNWHTFSPSSDLSVAKNYGPAPNGQDRSLELAYREPRPRPPIDSLVQEYNVTGDASWLLHFAIIGFPKCGTSTLMFHLQNHPEVQIFSDERCDMAFNKQARLIRDLYNDFPEGDYARGLKCPMDVESTQLGMPNYLQYFPTTRFLVGIRHPVLWFESFYNFRIHNEFNMPAPNDLIGKCRKGFYNLCTFRANFHIPLINLGKTNRTEQELQYVASQWHPRSIRPLPPNNRKILLYEVSQLSDPKYEAPFRIDLQTFLGLQKEIPPMIWFKPGKKHTDAQVIEKTSLKKINICDDEFQDLRAILTEQAVNASRWIREYFVHARDVTISSPDYFINELMPSWERDPCLERK